MLHIVAVAESNPNFNIDPGLDPTSGALAQLTLQEQAAAVSDSDVNSLRQLEPATPSADNQATELKRIALTEVLNRQREGTLVGVTRSGSWADDEITYLNQTANLDPRSLQSSLDGTDNYRSRPGEFARQNNENEVGDIRQRDTVKSPDAVSTRVQGGGALALNARYHDSNSKWDIPARSYT